MRSDDADINIGAVLNGPGTTGSRRPTLRLRWGRALACAGLSVAALGVGAGVADAGQEVCSGLSSGKFDTSGSAGSVTVSAPAGYLIDGYCVKAGSDKSVTAGAVRYVTVDPPRATVTFSHPSGKSVSHYSISYISAPATTTTVPGTTTTVPGTTTTVPGTTTTVPGTTTTVASGGPTTTVSDSTTTSVASAGPTTSVASAGPTSTVSGSLPRTGSDSPARIIVIGFSVAALGATLWVLGSRRVVA